MCYIEIPFYSSCAHGSGLSIMTLADLWMKLLFQAKYTEILQDEASFYMEGLSQPVECLVCHKGIIASSDLIGDIKVWKSGNGELVSSINRSAYRQCSANLDDDFKLQFQVSTDLSLTQLPSLTQ